MNDKRHGRDNTYNKNGDWRCGKNRFREDGIVVKDDWIKEWVIGENISIK